MIKLCKDNPTPLPSQKPPQTKIKTPQMKATKKQTKNIEKKNPRKTASLRTRVILDVALKRS